MIHDIILWLGQHFSPEQYLFWTRIQCVAWTAADVVIVFSLLQIANLGRRLLARRPHRIPFLILAITVCGVPFVIFAASGWRIFVLELLITIPHFLLILYIAVADFRFLAPTINLLVNKTEQTS